MDELPIGRRVAYWRQRRRMSQQVFADRLGKSKSWVDKVERGVRRLDKFSVLHEIADVLQLEVSLLMGRDPQRKADSSNCVDQIEVEEIRVALEQYDRITALFERPGGEPPPVEDLNKAVTHAWLTFEHAKYGVLARLLPGLLRDMQAADTAYSGESARKAAHLLAQVYLMASSTLRKLGEFELCWLAADRAIAVAQRAGDPNLAGVATFRVANGLLALGRARAALDLNVTVANRLAPHEDDVNALSVHGILLLQGVMAAARAGDSSTVDDLLRCAADAAGRLGQDDNRYWTSFGPTNVELHRAAAAVEMGEGGRAVETHLNLDPSRLAVLIPERRAHHFLDVARGYAQTGDLATAGDMLLEADRFAPSEIRCRPIAHEAMSDIVRRTRGSVPPALAELADYMGITV